MITSITIRNFKKLQEINFDLEKTVVLIGPNNSGKTSVLQALTLWAAGMKKINEARVKDKGKSKRVGVALNRLDLMAIPISSSKLIWHHQNVREISKIEGSQKNVKH